LFREFNFWPTYLGSRTDFGDEEKGALPVLVWPEQDYFLSSNGTNDDRTRKRPREPIEDDDGDYGNIGAKKKLRPGLWERMSTLIKKKMPVFFSYFSSQKTVTLPKPTEEISTGNAVEHVSFIESLPIYGSGSSGEKAEAVTTIALSSPHMTLATLVRSSVFISLTRKGFFIGPGDIYGSDYSIYVGDPSQGHSVATIRLGIC
jgi:tRNA intron endonuclease, catalytic C-terminal domain